MQYTTTYLEINNAWWYGVTVLREIDGSGSFEPQFISLDALKEEYS